MTTEIPPESSINVRYAEELSRYEQALRNFRCVQQDCIHFNLTKLCFHARGLLRAVFGL
jgi:hypothetical protein